MEPKESTNHLFVNLTKVFVLSNPKPVLKGECREELYLKQILKDRFQIIENYFSLEELQTQGLANLGELRAIIVTTGRQAKNLCELTKSNDQVVSIIVFCQRVDFHEKNLSQYDKVLRGGVVDDLVDVIHNISQFGCQKIVALEWIAAFEEKYKFFDQARKGLINFSKLSDVEESKLKNLEEAQKYEFLRTTDCQMSIVYLIIIHGGIRGILKRDVEKALKSVMRNQEDQIKIEKHFQNQIKLLKCILNCYIDTENDNYSYINKCLTLDQIKRMSPCLQALNQFITKYPQKCLTDQKVLYRGVSRHIEAEYEVGKQLFWPFLVSTSRSIDLALMFTEPEGSKQKNGVLFKILYDSYHPHIDLMLLLFSKYGQILNLEDIPENERQNYMLSQEGQVLFMPYLKFKVIKVEKTLKYYEQTYKNVTLITIQVLPHVGRPGQLNLSKQLMDFFLENTKFNAIFVMATYYLNSSLPGVFKKLNLDENMSDNEEKIALEMQEVIRSNLQKYFYQFLGSIRKTIFQKHEDFYQQVKNRIIQKLGIMFLQKLQEFIQEDTREDVTYSLKVKDVLQNQTVKLAEACSNLIKLELLHCLEQYVGIQKPLKHLQQK